MTSFDALRKLPDGTEFVRNGVPAKKIQSLADEDGPRVKYEITAGEFGGIAFEDSQGDATYSVS